MIEEMRVREPKYLGICEKVTLSNLRRFWNTSTSKAVTFFLSVLSHFQQHMFQRPKPAAVRSLGSAGELSSSESWRTFGLHRSYVTIYG